MLSDCLLQSIQNTFEHSFDDLATSLTKILDKSVKACVLETVKLKDQTI